MKNIIVSAGWGANPEIQERLLRSYSQFFEALQERLPAGHPDGLAKQAREVCDIGRGLLEGRVVDRRDLLGARAHFFMPLEVPRYWLPLGEILRHLPEGKRPYSVLEIGGGVGAGVVALGSVMAAQGARLMVEVTSLESDRAAGTVYDISMEVLRRLTGFPTKVERQVGDVTSLLRKVAGERFDLVLVSDMERLFGARDAGSEGGDVTSVVERLLRERVKKTGALLVMEGASKRTSRALSGLLGAMQERGHGTFAPCATGGRCPYMETREKYCLHSVSVPVTPLAQSVGSRANLRVHESHFCYGILTPQGERYVPAGLEAGEGQFLGRVVSFPDRRPHGFAYDVCTGDGVVSVLAPRVLDDGSTKGGRLPHGVWVVVERERKRR